MLPGPVSHALAALASAPRGKTVTFAIPPRFKATTSSASDENSKASTYDLRGLAFGPIVIQRQAVARNVIDRLPRSDGAGREREEPTELAIETRGDRGGGGVRRKRGE
jgi:hypothetical protein